MSIVTEAFANINSINKQIELARIHLSKADECTNFYGRLLEEVSKEHAKCVWQTNRHLAQMKSLEDTFDVRLKEVEAPLWKKYTENYNVKLSQKDIIAYIGGEQDYLDMIELKHEILLVRRELEAYSKGLESMGFQIKHVTELRVKELEYAVV